MPPREFSGGPEDGSNLPRGRPAPRFATSPVICHGEVTDRIRQGGCLRGIVLETHFDSTRPRYAVFLLSSWRKEYTVLGFNTAKRPRLFCDLDRIFGLIRVDYQFEGTVAIRVASEAPRGHSWRISQGTNFSRPILRKDIRQVRDEG